MRTKRRVKNRISRIGVALIAAFLMMTAVVFPETAEAANGTETLHITKGLAGSTFSIYQIQTGSRESSDLTTTAAFQGCLDGTGLDLNFEDLKENEIRDKVEKVEPKLISWIEKQKIEPTATVTADANRTADVAGLEQGMYLVVGSNTTTTSTKNGKQVTTTNTQQPALIYLPIYSYDENGVATRDNTIAIKAGQPSEVTTEIPKTPTPTPTKLSQTGQLWWPVSILIGGGLVILIIGMKMKRRENRKLQES